MSVNETPRMLFTCDDCGEELAIEMEWRARSYSDEIGYYDIQETEQKLIDEDEWTIEKDKDNHIENHFCCECN